MTGGEEQVIYLGGKVGIHSSCTVNWESIGKRGNKKEGKRPESGGTCTFNHTQQKEERISFFGQGRGKDGGQKSKVWRQYNRDKPDPETGREGTIE